MVFSKAVDLRGVNEGFAARFWDRVDVKAPDECWPWLGTRTSAGYGFCCVSPTVRITSSRVALALKLGGVIPDGIQACHHCDNPPCCNPEHLFAGTCSDNITDAITKGRWTSRRGTDHHDARLTPEIVRAIRAHDFSYGDVSRLAREFGVSRICIRKVRDGLSWSHVS